MKTILAIAMVVVVLVGAGGVAAQSPQNTEAYLDVPYADLSDAQVLDLYIPTEGDGPFPLVIFIHGGGWLQGDKSTLTIEAAANLMRAGYAVASVNYRLSGEAPYPAAVEDVKAAVRWLRANAATYNLDPDRFAAWGSSAGGHLAALLGTTGDVPIFDNPALGNADVSSRVQAVIDWFGPTDLTVIGDDFATSALCDEDDAARMVVVVALFLGQTPVRAPDVAAAASPISYVTEDDPPFLIQHGSADCLVPVQQSEHLYAALVAALGVDQVELTIFDGMGHGAQPPILAPSNIVKMIAFLDEVLLAE